jgi:uncharacterized protein YbcV (DUF1398 family)
MDINIINECNKLSLAGKITFPEVVKKLSSVGIERYMVDLVGKQKLSYGSEGEFYKTALELDTPQVAQNFDEAMVKNAITAIQQGKINYVTFLFHIMEAGCCHYEVFIKGKKAIYFGRDGSFHIENFPNK